MIPLPKLPEWSTHDDLSGMVPSEIRTAIRHLQREAMRAALSYVMRELDGTPAAYDISEMRIEGEPAWMT